MTNNQIIALLGKHTIDAEVKRGMVWAQEWHAHEDGAYSARWVPIRDETDVLDLIS